MEDFIMRKKLLSIFVVLTSFFVFFVVPVKATAASLDWKTQYLNYISNIKNNGINQAKFWLYDFDNNGIPELIYDSGFHLSGGTLSFFKDGKIATQGIGRGKYLKKSNYFYSYYKSQGSIFEVVYRISGNNSIVVFTGLATLIGTDLSKNSPTDYSYKYIVEGSTKYTNVSYNNYIRKRNSIFDVNSAESLENKYMYNYSTIKSAISNYRNTSNSKPVVKLSNQINGIRVEWNPINEIFCYNLFYKKSSDSTWTRVDVSSSQNYYTIPNCVSGVKYFVQVSPEFGSGYSPIYSNVNSLTFISRTNINNLSYNGNNSLTWNKVNGANNYQIARIKKGDSAFTYFTTNNNTFTEANAIGGTMYTYQVRAMYQTSNSGIAYGAWSSSKSVVTLVKPTVTLYSQSNAVLAKWNSIRGALKYVVYFKTAAATKWNQASVTGLSIPITGVKKGTKYFVQVRPVGKYEYGPYSTAKSIVFSPLQNYSVTKTTVTLSNKTNGINATWKPVNGAGKYIVYFKSASAANWSSVETAKNTFLLTNTVKGLRYYVQVQPVINYALGAYSSPVSIVR